ncbi:Predicted membrane protein [Proteus mirabilis]|uniref:Predicted membrane protein n=1 Tax=Proteus mirabilis TaxID=584 RepID=A0A379FGQ9_PROMI|nr:Predicted membrane protein [Proteus mirabilis]
MLYLFGAIILAFLFYYYRDFVEIVWYSSDYSAMIETNWKTGSYINSIYWRLDELSDFIFNLVRQYSWFLIGAMLMGAALMASGWLQRRYSQSHYGLIAVCFLVISLLFQGTLVITDYYLDWHYMWSAVVAQPITMVIQIIQSLGYIALLYWAWPYIQHSFIAYALRCVGKMALTTYLLQSIIGTTLFQRMGLFNQFTLLQLMLFVMAIWVINIIFAVTWLRYFSQGPIEWLWRHSSTGLAKRF